LLKSHSHDSSLIEGWGRFHDTNGNWVEYGQLCEMALNSSSDGLVFALNLALRLLIKGHISNSQSIRSAIIRCLKTLQRDWFSPAQNEWLLTCFWSRDLTQHCDDLPRLLLLLIEAGAPILEKNHLGQNLIASFMYSLRRLGKDVPTCISILSILVEKGVGVNDTCVAGLTPSMYAQHRECWDEWCEALHRAGKQIQDVVDMEGNSWLLSDDWQKVWIERHYHSWWLYNNDESTSEYDKENEDFDEESESEESDDQESGEETLHERETGLLTDNRPGFDYSIAFDTHIESNSTVVDDTSAEHIYQVISSEIKPMLDR
jgi:hypothetical protein